MASTVQIAERIKEIESNLAALQCAYATVIGQPTSASIPGSAAWTHLKPRELRAEMQACRQELLALQSGAVVVRTYPKYWRFNNSPSGQGIR